MLTPAVVTRLEKTATDNGFDRELPSQGDWLRFASTQVPLTVAKNGDVLVSERLGDSDRCALGLDVRLRVKSLDDSHQVYLRFHRERVFREGS